MKDLFRLEYQTSFDIKKGVDDRNACFKYQVLKTVKTFKREFSDTGVKVEHIGTDTTALTYLTQHHYDFNNATIKEYDTALEAAEAHKDKLEKLYAEIE